MVIKGKEAVYFVVYQLYYVLLYFFLCKKTCNDFIRIFLVKHCSIYAIKTLKNVNDYKSIAFYLLDKMHKNSIMKFNRFYD